MLILGIETATVKAGCAIGGHEGVLASAHSGKAKRHAENLTPAIEFICGQAGIELGEIGLVAVDVGPGLGVEHVAARQAGGLDDFSDFGGGFALGDVEVKELHFVSVGFLVLGQRGQVLLAQRAGGVGGAAR